MLVRWKPHLHNSDAVTKYHVLIFLVVTALVRARDEMVVWYYLAIANIASQRKGS